MSMGVALACLSGAAQATDAPRWDKLATDIFQNYAREQGLPPILPTALAQDRDGFIWIGNQSGLVRWDGYRFLQYSGSAPGGSHGLPAGWIRALHVDAKGQLWIGTDANGLARYDRLRDRFTPQPIRAGGGPDRIGAIADDGRGGLWVGADMGLYHIGAGGSVDPPLRHHQGDPSSLFPGDSIQALILDREGRLWIGADKGLARLDRGGKHITRIPFGGAATRDVFAVSALYQDIRGAIWVGTMQHGLYRVEPESDEAATFDAHDATGWTTTGHRISAIAPAGGREIWVAMRASGIVAVDLDTNQIRRIRHNQLLPSSLAHDDVWTLMQDRAGSLWIGGGGGLSYHANDLGSVITIFGDTGLPNGVTDPDISAILSASDGKVWLGFLTGGVDILDPKVGRVASLRPNAAHPDTALPQDVVSDMAEAPDGAIFIGTVRGLYRADRSGGGAQLVRPKGREPHAYVRAVFVDGPTLWIGGPSGLWRMPVAGRGAPAEIAKLTGRSVFTLLRGAHRDLWIGATDGLGRLDLDTNAIEDIRPDAAKPSALPAPLVSSLLQDRKGRLWVGTFGGGVAVMVGRDATGRPQFRRIGIKDGLPDLNIDKLLLDGAGFIWVSTDDGLAVIDPATFGVRAVQHGAGALLSTYWAKSGATDRWGEPLFGAKGGFSVATPGWPRTGVEPAPIVISDIRVAGQPVPGGRFNGNGSDAPLVLDPGAKSLAVEFAALDFTAPERNRYAYRLDGFDRDWIEVDATRRLAAYTNLPPGRYVLELRGSNRDGVWTSSTLKVPVQVLAAWYQTVWFRLLLVVAAVAIGFAIIAVAVQRRTDALSRRQMELEQHIARRTAELRTANERLSVLAKTDTLTGCATRRHFMERAEELVEMGRRGMAISLAIIDLDNFKQINDRHGHPVGDDVLRLAASACMDEVRAADMIGRIGGEEFAVLMPNTRAAEGLALAERLREALASADFKVGDATIRTTASIGLAEQRGGEAFASLYARADAALYAAKARGRNRVVADPAATPTLSPAEIAAGIA